MRIPDDIVSLLEALPIEAVAHRLGVTVRRHMALCFMHDDHHPSLAFSTEKNSFFCFACQKGGGPIRLVQEHEGWSFQEACVWLASQFDIPLPSDAGVAPQRSTPRSPRTSTPTSPVRYRGIDRGVGEWLLAHAGLSEKARAFLYGVRRYRPEAVVQLGIASLEDAAAMGRRMERVFGSERCRKSGFFWDDERLALIYDSPCLLFPFYTPDGELYSIQSRYLGDSPQTPRFRFPKEVRPGLFNAPVLSVMATDEPLYVAEGVTDCLALLSSGKKAVAFPGAAIHPMEDVALLAGRRLYMYPDRDDAGERLFVRLNELLQPYGSSICRMVLPEGCKDCSDMYLSSRLSDDSGGDRDCRPATTTFKRTNQRLYKMTVKEVFDLRKQGKIEEAYEAIRPMYAVHKGKYTTLCMFWVGSDILKKRLQEDQGAEAARIFEALLRVAPAIDDRDGKAHEALLHDALRVKEKVPAFSMLSFLHQYGVERLTDADWQPVVPAAADEGASAGGTGSPLRHPLPSTAQRLMTQGFHELQQHPDGDHAQMLLPLLQEAQRRGLRDKHSRRYLAVALHLAGDDAKAMDLYRDLLKRYHDSYLYAELAELTTDPGPKAALLCRAIQNQRQEKFCTGYRLALAGLLAGRDDRRAAYELQRCLATRQAGGYKPTREMLRLQRQLAGVEPVTAAEQRDFYRRMAVKY